MKPNEGRLDRSLRILLGVALILWAAVFNGPGWAWIGVLPLISGLTGFCGLYALLGMNTCKIK